MDKILQHHSKLRRNFDRSVFAAITFNLGPQSCCSAHRDTHNVAYGWCAVTALGDYDPIEGGHLILYDLGLAIQFPPGSTILLPSSVLEHGNALIGVHEKHFSITQYSSGSLFQWVDNNFQSLKDIRAPMNHAERAAHQRNHNQGRYRHLDLLPSF